MPARLAPRGGGGGGTGRDAGPDEEKPNIQPKTNEMREGDTRSDELDNKEAMATNDFTLALQPDEGGAANCTTIIHTNKMPPNGDNGVINSGALNEVPPDGYLLAEEPGGAPPATEDGDTFDCGRDKVASLHTGRVPGDR